MWKSKLDIWNKGNYQQIWTFRRPFWMFLQRSLLQTLKNYESQYQNCLVGTKKDELYAWRNCVPQCSFIDRKKYNLRTAKHTDIKNTTESSINLDNSLKRSLRPSYYLEMYDDYVCLTGTERK